MKNDDFNAIAEAEKKKHLNKRLWEQDMKKKNTVPNNVSASFGKADRQSPSGNMPSVMAASSAA